jgi:hypothetical protein
MMNSDPSTNHGKAPAQTKVTHDKPAYPLCLDRHVKLFMSTQVSVGV